MAVVWVFNQLLTSEDYNSARRINWKCGEWERERERNNNNENHAQLSDWYGFEQTASDLKKMLQSNSKPSIELNIFVIRTGASARVYCIRTHRSKLTNGLNWKTIIKTVEFRKFFWCDYILKQRESKKIIFFSPVFCWNKFESRINSIDGEEIERRMVLETSFDRIKSKSV